MQLFFGTTFINLHWPQADILLIYQFFFVFLFVCFFVCMQIFRKKVLIKILSIRWKGQCLSFNLVPILLLCVEHWLSYD